MRKAILVTVIAMILCLGCTSETKANNGNYYPETLVVSNITKPHEWKNDTNYWLIQGTNAMGQKFEWYSEDGDWLPFDFVSVVMYDNGTEIVYDDEIRQAQYSGRLEDYEYICDDWHGNGVPEDYYGFVSEINGTSAER